MAVAAPAAAAARLTLGPVPFNWSPTDWRDFYFRIADESAIDDVYVGEVICSKRSLFFEDLYPAVLQRLTAAGKSVILSTLAMVFLSGDRATMAQVCTDREALIEANDVSALFHLRGRPHHVGPFVNVYNERTLDVLAKAGARNFCLPAEVPADVIRRVCERAASTGTTIEVQSFGRMSLALSARCYHARAHGRTRDGCQFVCGREQDGMVINTLDGAPFLVVNGNQVQSFTWLTLLGEIGALKRAGVTRFRLAPQSCDMVQVARIFRRVVDGELAEDEGFADLLAAVPGADFANGFYHGRPGHSWTSP
ncbi:MAG: ubiquinone anaerobic biosynthesis protein UbiV [Bauldia sp.]